MTTTTVEELEPMVELPGARLKHERESKGFSAEYVAERLHLRVRVIELLEAGEYDMLPESVFVKGYIRAYAQLLEIEYEPLLEEYKRIIKPTPKTERALWQSQREVHQGMHLLRWISILSLALVLLVVGTWWHKAKDSLSVSEDQKRDALTAAGSKKVTLTDLNKMRTIVELPKQGKQRG